MKINTQKLKKFPKKSKKYTDQPLNDKSNTLCVSYNGIDTGNTNKLAKCNHDDVQHNFWSKLFVLPVNTCFSNIMSKYSMLTGIYIPLILYLSAETLGNPTSSDSGNETPRVASPKTGLSAIFSWENIKEIPQKVNDLFKTHVLCFFTGRRENTCIRSFLLFIAMVGGVLLIIGFIFTCLYKRGLCCCKPSKNKKKKGQDDFRTQFEQMQLQMKMQQDQLLRALMSASPTQEDDNDEDDDEEYEEEDEEEDEEDEEKNEEKKKDEKDEEDEKDEKDEKDKKDEKRNHGKGEEKNHEEDEEKNHEEEEKNKDEDKGKTKDANKGKNKDEENERKKDEDKEKGKEKAQVCTHSTENPNSKNDNIHIGYHAVT
ncbi:hypothetical protein POVCU2_0055820 [Plasmodium ovale curtisi]|uniref:PIR Superfamily Protein n=1 Tax=Plasmodium ovale curtisi TaxID=864141 RepID=A0A1A8W9R6_PLAOA|nr:hypothetical protein POVCU2_0055820 [Plasmodium ovale curtisi]